MNFNLIISDYKKGEEIAKRFPDNIIMQSQLMSIYIKTEKYNEAEDIAKKHPDNIIIKSIYSY